MYFAIVTAATATVFIVLGLSVINRFFSYYVDKIHEETQNMLVMHAAAYYKTHKTWEGYDGEELGAIAKISGDYFTVADLQGREIYNGEKTVERCCANPNHVYTRVKRPILVDGALVGELTAGYFANHISSPEADAFRGGGVSLVVLSTLCISLIGAVISLLFFYRLSKPIQGIASAARAISRGRLRTQINIQSNVSELHEIADSINTLGSSLLSQENFRQRLVVELSHELRTPLQILLNQIEAMLDGIYKPDTPRLESMHAEISRTAELLNELEDRLIYEADTFDLHIAPVDISEIARKVAVGHEGGFAQKNLDFSYTVEPGIVIEADSVRFAQVLINILSNALKYTAAGRTTFTLRRTTHFIEIVVDDTGEGMEPETLDNALNRSGQTFKAVNSKGVGLYIAKLIADKHGWDFAVNSRQGGGTCVTIKIFYKNESHLRLRRGRPLPRTP